MSDSPKVPIAEDLRSLYRLCCDEREENEGLMEFRADGLINLIERISRAEAALEASQQENKRLNELLKSKE